MEKDIIYLELDRIPVFIGIKGSKKRLIEKKFNSNIQVNSKTGEVIIESENSVNIFILKNLISAINHGHNPDNTLLLEDENYVLDVIDLKNYINESNRIKIVLGRIIGKNGSTRKTIEDITKTHLAIKDSIISIIGPYENTILVHEAIDMLIKGASHKTLYTYLERNKHESATGLI